jgi:hypothetical protein
MDRAIAARRAFTNVQGFPTMTPRHPFLTFTLLAGLAGAGASAQAYVLDFGNSAADVVSGCASASGNCSTFTRLLPTYGDVAGIVDVRTHAYDGGTLTWWNTGYNDLYGVAMNNAPSVAAPAWIDLVPLSGGLAVTLKHFDLGGYYQSRRDNVAVKVLAIGSDTPLFSYTGSIGSTGAGGQHTGFDLHLSSLTGLRIQWADPAVAANTGIDNIRFDVAAPVPEPASAALLFCGLATVAFKARRQRPAEGR